MKTSEDIEEAASVLRNINMPQGKKRTMKASQTNSRKKLSLAKNQKELELQETSSDESDKEDLQSSRKVTQDVDNDTQGSQGEQVEETVAHRADRTAMRKTKKFATYFQYSIGDGKGTFYVDANCGQALLNWGVATYKRIMHPDYYLDNTVMNTFLFAVRSRYKEAIFTADKWELHLKDWLDHEMQDKALMKARKEEFKDVNKVCRLLVTSGKDKNNGHYQVLVIEREVREITLIEYTKIEVLHDCQLVGMRNAIISLGWCGKNHLRLSKSMGRGKNPDLDKKKSMWFYNHIHYARPHEFQHDKGTSDCAPFAALVYLTCMSNRSADFRADLLSYQEYDDHNIRWLFLMQMHKILPSYVDEEFLNLVYIRDTDENDHNHMDYSRQFFGLTEDKLKAAVTPRNDVNCLCGDKNHKTTNIFIPSCCFRSYHADCYIKQFCKQITTNQEHICFCDLCKASSKVLLGIQDTEATNIEEVHKLGNSKEAIFKQMILFSGKDDKHR